MSAGVNSSVGTVNDEVEVYARYHYKRYSYLIALVHDLLPERKSRILDVGRGLFTNILAAEYPNVTTLGFASAISAMPMVPKHIPHIVFDLNGAQHKSNWTTLPQFDLIVFAEVIEHLYTAPELVMSMLSSSLAQDGYCIVQTPNAVALHKRVLSVCGRNPYERIRLDNSEPGHFREYTKHELVAIGRYAGLTVVRHEYKNYFGVQGGALRKLAGTLFELVTLPFPSLRRGQTIVFHKL
ncbi:MAG TPA: class I SAM-dependent methyltransferase [Terriglobales bacterium]|jgi:trans-aconitate methyltransferase